MDCSMPNFPVHHHFPRLLKLLSIESVMSSNPLILCCPPLLLPSVFPSFSVFSSESTLHIRQSIGASALVLPIVIQSWFPLWLTGLIWLLSVDAQVSSPGTTASILQCSVFFMVQLSPPYMTTGKTIALTRQTFVDMSAPWCSSAFKVRAASTERST